MNYDDKHQQRDYYFQNIHPCIEFANRFQIKIKFSH